ncbi:MAG: hypothetical protein LVR00_02795 [Rhabdochlamydiaceae bacterium]
MTSKNEYLKLVAEVHHHDKLYFVESQPTISDYEYDLLYKNSRRSSRSILNGPFFLLLRNGSAML